MENSESNEKKWISAREKRQILFEQDPHCCYCGIEVKNYPYKKGVSNPDDTATLEHLYPRYKGKRHYNGKLSFREKYALSCRKCNEKMGREHELMLLACRDKKVRKTTRYIESICTGKNYLALIKA